MYSGLYQFPCMIKYNYMPNLSTHTQLEFSMPTDPQTPHNVRINIPTSSLAYECTHLTNKIRSVQVKVQISYSPFRIARRA